MTKPKTNRELADYLVNSCMGLANRYAGPDFLQLKDEMAKALDEAELRGASQKQDKSDIPKECVAECAHHSIENLAHAVSCNSGAMTEAGHAYLLEAAKEVVEWFNQPDVPMGDFPATRKDWVDYEKALNEKKEQK